MGDAKMTDHEVLKNMLQQLGDSQLQELCLYFPKSTDLGMALRGRLEQWRADFRPYSDGGEDRSLQELILETVENNENFTKYFWTELCAFMDKKGVDYEATLQDAAGVSEATFGFHKKKWIKSVGNREWKTTTDRDNILSLGIALELNLMELKDLMAYAGQPFYPGTNDRDYVIARCVRDGKDPEYINQMLDRADMKCLPVTRTVTQQKKIKSGGEDSQLPPAK